MGRARIIKADPGAGVPGDLRGRSRIPQRPLTAGVGATPTERRTASVYLSTRDVRPRSAAFAPTSMGSVAAMKVMKGVHDRNDEPSGQG